MSTISDGPDAHAARTNLTVRDAVYDLLRQLGINRIFGNPGSTELPLFRQFPDDFEYVLGLQEAVAVAMADGYAQATGNASLINLHSAVGVGHGMGNLYTAYKNQTPLIVIAGQQARSILPYEPYLSSAQPTELPRPYVKYSVQPARAQDVPRAIARAYYAAMQPPRGPVLVSVPVDDWDQPADESLVVRSVSQRVAPDPEALATVARALDQARRPAFVVGTGVDRDGAWDAMVALAETHQAAVFVAPFAARCGFPEDHALFRGFLPAARERIVALLQEHDVIVVVGAPAFIYHVEGHGPFIPEGASLFQITDNPEEAHWAPVGSALISHVGLALEALCRQTSPAARQPLPPRVRPERAPATSPMSVAYVLQTLADVRTAEDIVVEEAPSSRIVMHDRLPILRPGTFYTMASGGLGYALPAAVGIAMARPERRVICVIGDGSLMYSPQALWSAAQANTQLTVLVINNAGYGAMQRFAGVFGFPPEQRIPGIHLSGMNFCELATAHGCTAFRVEQGDELADVLRTALATPGPTLVEAVVEPAVH